jgi:hypothetical protein
MFRFLKSFFHSNDSAPTTCRNAGSFRPTLESLEDRLVPSSSPAAPAFSISDTSGTQVSMSWNRVSNASSYVIYEWTATGGQAIGTLGSNTTGCLVSNLTVGTTYYFDVAARNSAGTTLGNWQKIVTVDHPTVGLTSQEIQAGWNASNSAYTPVAGSLFGTSGPSYRDVQQGSVGDCWLLASLAEVAARDPADIRNMFTYLGTEVENGATVGLYSVRLFDSSGTAHYVTVDTELPGGGGLYDHPANGVLWVALAEKAYAEANGLHEVKTNNVGSDSYNALNGGDPVWALQAITGKSASDFSINPTNIAAAWNAGDLIVLCTPSNPANADIVGGHAYAVVGYTPSSSMPFLVYNPWGTNSSGWALGTENGHQVYGLFNASAGFLSQNFTTQSVGVGAEAAGTAATRQPALTPAGQAGQSTGLPMPGKESLPYDTTAHDWWASQFMQVGLTSDLG